MSRNKNPDWAAIILANKDPRQAWEQIFKALLELSQDAESPEILHRLTVEPDRLLSEAAWELWHSYPETANTTANNLKAWVQDGSCAVLILDALSLRELPHILNAAHARNIEPSKIMITGAEAPSTTTQFAKALGASTRSALANNKKPKDFILSGENSYTDVLNFPFEDCPVQPYPNIFYWHSWLDDLLHVQKHSPELINKLAAQMFQSDGFWNFLTKLRQGRKVLITSDHGYAVSKQFSSELKDPVQIKNLAAAMGQARYKAYDGSLEEMTPPVLMEHNGQYIVLGQCKWKVAGGFPHVCHGGLSLLEVAVPWLEFSAL